MIRRRKPLRRKALKPKRGPKIKCGHCKRRPITLALGLCRSHARDEADRRCRNLVRARGACQVCKSTEKLQWAHGFSRSYLAVRWDLANGFCLCSGCHVRYTHDPLGWMDWMRETLGLAKFNDLWVRARSSTGPPDYERVLADLDAGTPGGQNDGS